MIQELFSIGSFSISPFGVLLVAALFSAYAQLRWGFERFKIGDDEDASAVVFACGLAGILGGKIYYAILYGDLMLVFDRAGIVWYGSFLAGVAAFLWSVRRRGLPFGRAFDSGAPALAIGYAIGRVGCFLVGDDYGRPTDLAWGVVFKHGLPPTTAGILRDQFGADIPADVAANEWIAVHPTQLYETGLALAIWAIAMWRLRRVTGDAPPATSRPGGVFLFTMTLLALERFGIEFLRAKDDRFFGHFTLAQLISVAILVVLAAVAWRRRGAAGEGSAAAEIAG